MVRLARPKPITTCDRGPSAQGNSTHFHAKGYP
jgi:hypothetical protein